MDPGRGKAPPATASTHLKDPKLSLFTSSETSANCLIRIRNRSCRQDDSDEDQFTVPDLERKIAVPKPAVNVVAGSAALTATSFSDLNKLPQLEKRRRSRNPADKECRRMKRLLRNRVSAQQARERKKVYVNDLEFRAKELEDKNNKLEEKVSTLTNENTMLRKVLMSTRPKPDVDFDSDNIK